ncbi:MAG: VCBS repeat-containing protein [Solirubrobacterales bacterium]|nr:VCBS repeat-containing protein [Solirubrobacterales bacterium]
MRTLLAAVVASALAAPAAHAAFPYTYDGSPPPDLSGKERWMYAATPEPGNLTVNASPFELGGVRGAHVVDEGDAPTAWQTTTGRPDVLIAVHDSGIRWDDRGAMRNLRRKTHLNAGELPRPRHDRAVALEDGADCARYRDADDANGDGVFNVVDFACDGRVERDGAARRVHGNGIDDLLDPQDVLIAFTDGRDDDRNGYADDVVGWDFLDDDNDPYDDVAYGHGTGEAQDSTAEAADGQDGVGTCPDCMVLHVRVGDSFIADSNRFAQGVLYSTDNGAAVVQEALGTLNNSRFARRAVEYAYAHGVTVIASAADEAAQHHNWPSSLPHVVVVNSVTKYDDTFSPAPRSYLQFTGCTNFSSKIAVAIPSVSCSSDATGRASGMAGLVISAGRDAGLDLAPDEVRALLASGTVDGTPQADDVDFAVTEVGCEPVPVPGCTDPSANAVLGPNAAVVSPLATSRRYPAKEGHDQFYGYGRVNMAHAVGAARAGRIPPSVALLAPDWWSPVDPRAATAEVRASVATRGDAPYRCRVLVAPGSYPTQSDFREVPSPWCDGSERRGRFEGVVARLDVAALKARFPATAQGFDGSAPSTGRPNTEPYGFTVRIVADATAGGVPVRGEDRRNLFLHHDPDALDGFPRYLDGSAGGSGDVEASPLLADLDGDGRNELVVTGSDGVVHALRPDGREARGWPVRVDRLAVHRGAPAYRTVPAPRGAVLASPAAGDLDHDGDLEVVVADWEGKVYAFSSRGRRLWTREAVRAWSGRPLSPFVPERRGHRNRVQHGFLASPVLADLDRNDGGRLEVIAAGMDRHVYAFGDDGRRVPGFPVLVVDPAKVAKVDPRSHRVDFKDGIGEALNQGAIVDTPAVGDLAGDARPEIVVGTNEEYEASADGGFHAAPLNAAALAAVGQTGVLSFANSRLYAISPDGARRDRPFLPGWPVKVGKVFAELLPVVGEGVTGAPVIGVVDCPSGGRGPKVGVIPDGGPAMVLNPDGSSCLGEVGGKPVGMQSDVPSGNPLRADLLVLPAVGHPAFGDVGGQGTSFLAPTTGLLRALDLTVNEYQGGEDSSSAWDPATGQFRPGFPQKVNDLSFLTGMSVADLGGAPGEEAVGGTAHLDLSAFGAGGAPPGPRWPKLTYDWTVANPVVGEFGGRRVVIAATRAGMLHAFATGAGVCAPASWPRYHHDARNTGDARTPLPAPKGC